MLMSKEAFKHLLLKYCQREARDGRDFCLAGLNVLEYQQVQELSEQAAQQLLRLVEDICLRSQREKDRLCRVGLGTFILILPDTDKKAAELTLERLVGTLSGAKTHYHQRPIRASTTFRIAHSKDLGANIEALLASIGLTLNEAGTIDLSKTGVTATKTSSDNFAIWLTRYKNVSSIGQECFDIGNHKIQATNFTAQDAWSNSQVLLRKFEFENDSIQDTLDKIIKRTRTLEELDHPSLIATKDFQLENENTLWLARHAVTHLPLKDYSRNKIGEETITNWCYQLLNLIVYLQSLIPPVVPPLFSQENLLVNENQHLLLTNFEAGYLFACLANGEQITSNTDLDYQAVIVSIAQLMKDLIDSSSMAEPKINSLFEKLKSPLPKDLGTAYKVRAALKPFEVCPNK